MTGGEGRFANSTPVRKISFPGHGTTVLPEVNLALLGDLGVGKSALTVKYLTKRFINEYDPELEDTYSRIAVLEGQEVVVNIMDTCDNKLNKDPDRYLKWANVFLVVYDLTNRSSFDQAIQTHLQPLALQQRCRRATSDSAIFLVANKVDLERYRQVSQAEGRCCANQYETFFYETTAAEEYEEASRVFHEAVRVGLQELERSASRCHNQRLSPEDRTIVNRVVYPRLLDRIPMHGRFLKDHRRSEDKSAIPTERVPKFKIFNKGFKIFQS